MKSFAFLIGSQLFYWLGTTIFVRCCLFLPASFILLHLKRLGAHIGKDVIIEVPIYFHNFDDKNKGNNFRNLKIGNNVYAGKNLFLDLRNIIDIGDNVTLAMNVTMITHTDAYRSKLKLRELPFTSSPISVGSHTYIGAGTTILENVSIGEKAVIGACSLVNKDIPSNNTAFGIPAKIVKRRQ